jgi:Zn-dependent protease with chaperone function
MNFFQEQEHARRHTMWLVGIFILAVLSLIVITVVFLVGLYLYSNDITIAMFMQAPLHYIPSDLLYGTIIVVLVVVVGGSLSKYMSLSSGGKAVAVALGGEKLNRNRADMQEQILLNVVDEMAIASGITAPTVYILDESAINAFAAGLTLDDAVIGVTRGTIEKLNREELQGVVAHEFSHIFNGDMRLNLQLTATLHGILLIGLIGRFILRAMSRTSHHSRSSSNKKGNGGLYLLALGGGLMAIGYAGTFFGSIIKANVSRKREYLADATAVQYTRYPQGISGALKKIAYYSSKLQSPSAETYSHLYFAEGVSTFFSSLMATHPPLKDRIKKIEPRWSGRLPDYGNTRFKKKSSTNKADKNTRQSRADKVERHYADQSLEEHREKTEDKRARKERFIQGSIATAMMQVGQIKEEEIEAVQVEISALDAKVQERLNDPLGAQAVILSLLYDETYKDKLFSVIQEENPYLLLEFASFMKEGHSELKKQSTLVIALAMNALKSLSIEQYQHFKTIVEAFVTVDGVVTLFEWSLQYIIQRPLELHLGVREVPKRTGTHIGAVKKEVETLYSMLVQAQYDDETAAKEAFDKTKKAIQAGALKYIPKEEIDHDLFLKAVTAIERTKPVIAERIFEGVLHSIKLDGKVSETENAFVHAIAQLMQVPLPREFKLEES